MRFTSDLETITNDFRNLTFDECTNVNLVNVCEDSECLVHRWIELGANVFSIETQRSAATA